MGSETFLAWIPHGWLLAFVVFWGAIWGSFANVVIARVPLGQSIVWPSSHCFTCETPIRWYDNLPILSWFWLRGRCRACGARIPVRYPVVELGGVGCALFAAWLAAGGVDLWRIAETSSWELLSAWLLLFFFLLCLWILFWIDLRHLLLPHAITAGLALGACVYAVVVPPGGDWRGFVFAHSWQEALIGFVVGFGSLYVFATLYMLVRRRHGIGGGDFMLFGALGAWFGWEALPVLILLAAVQGVLAAGVALLFFPSWIREVADDDDAFWSGEAEQRAQEQTDRHASPPAVVSTGRGIPFGPFLCVAAVEYAAFGGLYLSWLNGGF